MSAGPDESVAASAFLALLDSWQRSEPGAADRVFAALYEELHRLAHHHIRRSRPGETLCTTALVHEAYLKLAPRAAVNDRRHFFALASRTMRQILVDQARRHHSQKRGGGLEITTLDEGREGTAVIAAEILALEEALTRLSEVNDRLGQVVELRLQAGDACVAAAHAAMLHCGARGYLKSHRVQRRLREAYFVAIVTPATKQLRKMLAEA